MVVPNYTQFNPVRPDLASEAIKLQNELINTMAFVQQLPSVTPGKSGSEIIGSAPIVGVSGSTIYEQLVSIANGGSTIGITSIKRFASGNGTTDDYNAFVTAINAFNGSSGTLLIPSGNYRIANNLTIPSNVSLVFLLGGILQPDGGVTVTINGPVSSGVYQIFGGSGSIAGSMDTENIYPQWFGAKGDGITDDSSAFAKAFAAGPVIKIPAGTYIVSSSNSITTGKQVEGAGPTTVIRQITNNIPIFYMSGERVHLSGVKLEFATRQANPNKWGNAIHIQRLYESVIERIYINNAAHGIYCERYTTNDADTTNNYIYSCSIRDIRVTRFSYYAYYLSSINAGNTGCVFENLYCVNWDNFDLQTKLTSLGYYFFKNFSESFAAQLNSEWGVITESAFNFNSCDTFSLTSPHIEGVDSSTNFKSMFEASGGSKVLVSSGTMLNCKITAATQFAIVKLTSNNTTFELNGFKERLGTQGNYTTSSRPPFLGDSGMTTGSMEFLGCLFEGFTSNSSAPTVYPPLLKRFNDDIFYHTVGGRAIFYGSTTPTIGKWKTGDRIINTSTSPGTNAGWVCTLGGMLSPPASTVTTTVPVAFVNDIVVNAQGPFIIGDTITVVGSARVFVITNIFTSSGIVHFVLSQNIEVTVTNATVQYATPIFMMFEQAGVMTSIAATPLFAGQFATVGGLGYMAVGTASAADWKQITN